MYHLMDAVVEHPVPEGFFVRTFRPGEESVWIDINKCGILGPDAGMESWESMVVKMNGLVPERDILFATRADDIPVATLTAYVRDDGVGVIHMVSARESVRGRGIGKALLAIGMKKLRETTPPPPFTQLLTDDWRLPAIKVYLDAGVHPVKVSEDMPGRWRKVCENLGIRSVELLDPPCFSFRLGDGDNAAATFDFGPETVGGFAAFEVVSFSPTPDGTLPVLRLSYACHPEGLSPTGDFTREESAYYLHVDNPVLPANPGRHELYTIPRTGTFVAPLIQGQLRYVRAALDTPGTAVEIANLRIANPGVHSDAMPVGSFECSDPILNDIWGLGVRSCQLASLTNPDGWRIVEGKFLPRRLERGAADGWCRFMPDFDGTLELDVEFRRNPHFDAPAFFEVFTGQLDAEPAVRQTIRQEGVDGEIRTVRVPLKPGRFGFRREKEQWPVIHEVRVLDKTGKERWRDDFHAAGFGTRNSGFAETRLPKPGAAPNWVYPSAPPYLADGAKRDRLVWSGDLWWSQRTAYCAFGPGDPHLPGALRLLAFNQTPEGLIHAAPYAHNDAPPQSGDLGLFASDEFSAWFVPVLWEHYLWTGDEALVRELWPAADRDLHYLATRMGVDGLHEPRPETSKHAYKMECGDLSKRVYQNLVFWMAWRDGARLARALGHNERAGELEALAVAHAAAIRRVFRVPAEMPGASSWNTEIGKQGSDPLSCAMLLASGFADDAEAAAIVAERKLSGDGYGVGKFRILAMRGMLRHGLVGDAMRLLRGGNWPALADPAWPGAHCTTECLYLYTHGWWDESHPDTSVSDIFQTSILGVEPLEPGFRVFRIAPQMPEGIEWARGKVPTPHGMIEVEWHVTTRGQQQKDNPASLELAFTVPPETHAVIADGRTYRPGRHEIACNR